MKIRNWRVERFKSIEEGEFGASDNTVLIGKNNVGKSNIVESLSVFKTYFADGTSRPNIKHVLDKDIETISTIELEFSLDPIEYEGVLDQLSDSTSATARDNGWLNQLRVELSIRINKNNKTNVDSEFHSKWDYEWKDLSELNSMFRNKSIKNEYIEQMKDALETWKFIGPFRVPRDNAQTIFTKEDLKRDSSNLIRKLYSLKNGSQDSIFREIKSSYIGLMEGIEDIDIKFESESEGSDRATIEVGEKNYSSRFTASEMSSGSKEILALLTKIHLAQEDTQLLVIEEPELHLHPGAEQKVYDKIDSLVEDFDTQVIISTHSDVFVNQSEANSIIKVERPEHTVVRGIEEGEIGLELADLGYSQSGLLQSDAVVLVEGLSDKLILSEWASNLGLDLDEEGISIVEIEGNIDSHGRSLVKLLYSFDIPYLFIIDSDDDDFEEVEMRYKSKINREDADDIHVWWHTTPDHFIAWEDSDIEHFLLGSPEAIAAALGEDIEEVETIIDEAEAEKNVDVLERIWEEFDPDPEGVSTYEKDVHGRMIAKNMGEEELDEEVLDAMGEIQSLVSSD